MSFSIFSVAHVALTCFALAGNTCRDHGPMQQKDGDLTAWRRKIHRASSIAISNMGRRRHRVVYHAFRGPYGRDGVARTATMECKDERWTTGLLASLIRALED